MRISFKSFALGESIPILGLLNNKKLNKYFNRETSAGIAAFSDMAQGMEINSDTPLFYSTCVVEYEDFGLNKIVDACKDENGRFSQKLFVDLGMSSISPITQFKILYNMPLSFISIEKNLKGDNAVIYNSAKALIDCAKYSIKDEFIIGAGKVWKDGLVESGFAYMNIDELKYLQNYDDNTAAIEIFRDLSKSGVYNV